MTAPGGDGEPTPRKKRPSKRTTISKDKLAEYQWVTKNYVEMCKLLQSVVQEMGIQFRGDGTVSGDLIAAYHDLRAQLAERDALLLKGCNLINYSVSGMSVPILDWTRYIAECRALLGDAYREYDARAKGETP